MDTLSDLLEDFGHFWAKSTNGCIFGAFIALLLLLFFASFEGHWSPFNVGPLEKISALKGAASLWEVPCKGMHSPFEE